jgi:hypothetical protein
MKEKTRKAQQKKAQKNKSHPRKEKKRKEKTPTTVLSLSIVIDTEGGSPNHCELAAVSAPPGLQLGEKRAQHTGDPGAGLPMHNRVET